MIYVTLTANNKWLELRNAYAYREQIKALAGYPDVRWDGERGCWRVSAKLYWKLVGALGDLLTTDDPYDIIERLPDEGLTGWKVEPASRKRFRQAREALALVEGGLQ